MVQLAAYSGRHEPGRHGLSAQYQWRTLQFYQVHPTNEILSTGLRALPWSSPLHILSHIKRPEVHEFYLRIDAQSRSQGPVALRPAA